MSTAAVAFSPGVRPGWMDWLRRELAPSPGRGAMTLRIVVTVALVVIISMALQIPEALLSAYMVFFVTKENKVVTTARRPCDDRGGDHRHRGEPAYLPLYFRLSRSCAIPAMAAVLFGGFFFSRVFAIGPLAFGIGFVVAATQSIAELMPDAEYLVHSLLWLWVAITYPIALTVVVTRFCSRTARRRPPRPHKPLLAPDAFTNPRTCASPSR